MRLLRRAKSALLATPATLDLGTQSYSTDDTNWKESVVDDLFDFLNDTLGLSSLNISGDAANAFGGLIVRNDERGGAQASVEDSELTAGGALTVAAVGPIKRLPPLRSIADALRR